MIVRLFASAAAAAQVEELESDASGLGILRAELADKYGAELARVLNQSSYLVDGVAYPVQSEVSLVGVDTVDVLPPFVGG